MAISVGTFNLNNLFSRYNFKAEISPEDSKLNSKVEYTFTDEETYKVRTYTGKLVSGKPKVDTETIATRIKEMGVDVLAMQEVEDIDTLKEFNRDYLDTLYPYQVLVEGNDPRLIDVAIFSKLPIGAIVSWQKAVHPDNTAEFVFGRDLLEVEIFDQNRQSVLFTLFNNHLKSNYVPWDEEDKEEAEDQIKTRRKQQAEMVASIIKARMKGDSKFIIVGDMNDVPDSELLEPFVKDAELSLVNGLKDAKETRPAKQDDPMPPSPMWTHRFKASGKPAEYNLYDQIWLSPNLGDKIVEAKIGRRTKHKGDGSDHDPAWVVLEL
jgi:endonuclease/exonuclease/phosphatase family metal-dependent hydrolase